MISSGIYLIINNTDIKSYVGSASDITRRFTNHLYNLRHNKHYNKHLQSSWNKYGESNFEFHVIEYCPKEKLIEREQFYLDIFQTCKSENGFNKNPKAESCLGVKHSKEANERKSKRQKGHTWCRGMKMPEEFKKKISEIMKGNKYGSFERSEADKKRLREMNKGRKFSNETKEKMSKAIAKVWSNGRLVSEETKRKISISNIGRIVSEETRKKISIGNKGKKRTDEQNKRMSEKLKGRIASDETREKLSQATTKWWQDKRNIICQN